MTDDTNAIRAAHVINTRMLGTLPKGFRASPKPLAPDGLSSCVQMDNGAVLVGTNEKYQRFWVPFEYVGSSMSDDQWEEFLNEPLSEAWLSYVNKIDH